MKQYLAVMCACLLAAFFVRAVTPLDIEALDATSATPNVRMNQIQVIGTHNSYHIKPAEPLFSMIKAAYADAAGWDYTHAPLNEQLDRGVRSFELDVYADPAGTKVMHVPQYDTGSTCPTFKEALVALRAWSAAHPRHVPILTLVELKDEKIPQIQAPILPFDAGALEQLDREIRENIPAEGLLTPDDVRGDAATLSEAIRGKGWPLLDDARGKLMFVLHARGLHADLYTKGAPSLEARAMFMESQAGKPFASVFIYNDPSDPQIPDLVKQGYLVRTRADGDLKEAVKGETTRRDTALASGAHVVSTDFPIGEAHAGTGYVVALPENAPARVNPLGL